MTQPDNTEWLDRELVLFANKIQSEFMSFIIKYIDNPSCFKNIEKSPIDGLDILAEAKQSILSHFQQEKE